MLDVFVPCGGRGGQGMMPLTAAAAKIYLLFSTCNKYKLAVFLDSSEKVCLRTA